MAQRTVALLDGKYIGIETIYTVVSGHQINIPDKLKWLREKSQNNELFCPCGCGANLILVAGDKNVREQHFRIKDTDASRDCHFVTEGKKSVDSKIVLKCWLDDNLHSDDLETRVPISAVSDSTRKYEFSFISRSYRIAVNYCHDRANLSDEKLQILEDNTRGIGVIHIVDYLNGGSEGQYPEGLMKIQNRQGYCLLLSVEEADYDRAYLRAVFYEKDIEGLWRENAFAYGALKEYKILPNGSITLNGRGLFELLEAERKRFAEGIASERKRREEAEKQRAEFLNQQRLEAERWRAEQQKRREEAEERRLEEERIKKEAQKSAEEFNSRLEELLNQQETQVKDPEGNRWIKCEFCGKIAKEPEFPSYGGPVGVHLNLGICKECYKNNPKVKESFMDTTSIKPKTSYDPMTCPECGMKLIERTGKNGKFIGCTGFPNCRYTRSVKK